MRFTPTCVGTAQHGHKLLPAARGSPPRAWGRRSCSLGRPIRWSVHPHVRGDGSKQDTGEAETIGSPPRAWGRRRYVGAQAHIERFTPTCVGTAYPLR